jgi:hypothetical protein
MTSLVWAAGLFIGPILAWCGEFEVPIITGRKLV